jgi:hypothetical protein
MPNFDGNTRKCGTFPRHFRGVVKIFITEFAENRRGGRWENFRA